MNKTNHAPRRRVGRPRASRPRNELLRSPPEERVSYIDSLRLTLKRKIQPALLDLLIKAGGPPGTERTKPIIKPYKTPRGEVTLVTFHQPCFTTFELLQRVQDAYPFERVFEFSRVDIALELKAKDCSAANDMGDYLLSRLVPKMLRSRNAWIARDANGTTALAERKQRRGTKYDSFTAYLGTASHRGHVFAVYFNKPSKTQGGGPCTRLEWRFWGAAAVSKAGLREVESLALLDHAAFWDKRLRLLKDATGVSTQVRARRSQISHKWMLPCRENALWDDTWHVLHRSGGQMISAIKAKKYRLPDLGDAASGLL
jgi:hypothetical protein